MNDYDTVREWLSVCDIHGGIHAANCAQCAHIMASHNALARIEQREQRMRDALQRIQQWDCLNPPRPDLCADHPWLRRLVDEALEEPPA